MASTVLVLGAKGRLGRAVSSAFSSSGWQVRGFARSWSRLEETSGIDCIQGNAFDVDAVQHAAADCDVIINALNPPYPNWSKALPMLTDIVVAAAQFSGAVVIVSGNVYNFGRTMPVCLKENTPRQPDTKKGRLRHDMERTYAAAADQGVRTIVLRAGDFIERAKTGNWFDSYITKKVGLGKLVYPGPLDRLHAWAYLPDMARAMVALAERRHGFPSFESFGFPGFGLTGRELVSAIEEATGRKLKIGTMPWPIMHLISPFSPSIRQVLEMRYLWEVPHVIDGAKLAQALPDFQPSTLSSALDDALGLRRTN